MKVLVTGGTGFLGRAIVERLVAKGDSVRAIARRAPNSRLPDGVELHQGDISTPGAVASLARGAVPARPSDPDRCGSGNCDFADLCRYEKWDPRRRD